MLVYFVTSNENKIKEFKRIVDFHTIKDLEIKTYKFDSIEIQGSVTDISRNKCEQVVKYISEYPLTEQADGILVEDVGLEFNALNGLPGPYIKYFSEDLGPMGLYELVEHKDDKTAQAVCVYTYYDIEAMTYTQHIGRTNGTIVSPRSGPENFGWDSIFMPVSNNNANTQTYAEMSRVIKDIFSHRRKAITEWLKYLEFINTPVASKIE